MYASFLYFLKRIVFVKRHVWFFRIYVLVLIAGIVVLFNPFTAAAVPFIILGVSSIVYGLSDLINIIRFRQKKEPGMPEIEDITPIEEIKD